MPVSRIEKTDGTDGGLDAIDSERRVDWTKSEGRVRAAVSAERARGGRGKATEEGRSESWGASDVGVSVTSKGDTSRPPDFYGNSE